MLKLNFPVTCFSFCTVLGDRTGSLFPVGPYPVGFSLGEFVLLTVLTREFLWDVVAADLGTRQVDPCQAVGTFNHRAATEWLAAETSDEVQGVFLCKQKHLLPIVWPKPLYAISSVHKAPRKPGPDSSHCIPAPDPAYLSGHHCSYCFSWGVHVWGCSCHCMVSRWTRRWSSPRYYRHCPGDLCCSWLASPTKQP